MARRTQNFGTTACARAARVTVLVLVSVSAVGLASCGSSEPATQVHAGGASPLPIPDRFGRDPGRYVVVAATATHLVGFGAYDPAAPEVSEPVLDGEAVDLTSGRARPVAGPRMGADPAFLLGGATDHHVFVGIGRVCEDQQCQAGPGASFQLDPGTGTWTELEVPPGWAGAGPSSVPMITSRGDGHFIAAVVVGETTSIAVSDGVRWSEVGSIPASAGRLCATSNDLYFLARGPSTQGTSTGGNNIGGVLTRVDLASGKNEGLDLPDASLQFGGAGMAFGCGPDAPVIALNQPMMGGRPLASPTVAQFVDGIWTPSGKVPAGPGWEQFFPGEIVSGPAGVLVGLWAPGANPKAPNRLMYVTVHRDGAVRIIEVRRKGRDTDFYWRGDGDVLLAIETPERRTSPNLSQIPAWR